MNADVITDLTFPHGTADGYRQGCHGAHCPAPLPCRDVHRRYAGDWAFRKQVDAGIPLEQILHQEQETAREAAEAAKRARMARPGPRAKKGPYDGRAAANRARGDKLALIPRAVLRKHLDDGLTDRQIVDLYGYTRRQVAQSRATAGWERNPDPNRRSINQPPVTPGVSHSQEHA